MKKVYTFLIVLLSLSFVPNAEASHNIGGEITWECLNDGRYVFKMKIYRDCSGATWPFDIETLKVFGNPLPTDSNNQVIQNISLIPDSASWITSNFGDLSPDCNDIGGLVISCNQSDRGSYQEFPYKSRPIKLKGVPPTSGWRFVFTPPCCRPNVVNLGLGSSSSSILSAIMYANKNRDSMDSCYNSSPNFAEKIDYFSCRGEMKFSNNGVVDNENDSVVYSFGRTYGAPARSPQPIPYESGYSFNNPTPDRSFDTSNVAASLDSLNGLLTYKVNSGASSQDYWIVVRADEYRDNVIVSSIFREYKALVSDCFGGELTSSLTVNAWFNKGANLTKVLGPNYNLKVTPGSEVRIQLMSLLKDSLSNQFGANTDFSIASSQFSSSVNDSSLCANPPCAEFLMNNKTTYDSTSQSFIGSDRNNFLGSILWEPDCQHLDSNGASKTYQFNLERRTQLCDTIEINNEVINIEVVNEIEEQASLSCVSTWSNNKIELIWDTAGISINNFQFWSIYGSRPNGEFALIDTLHDYYLGRRGENEANFSMLDSAFFPNVYIQSNSMNCNFIVPGRPSDTLSKFATLTQVDDELVVQLSPAIGGYTYSWASCDSLTGERDSIYKIGTGKFIPPASGYYNAKAMGSNQSICRDITDCFYYKKPVGLNENSFQQTVRFYPNPTNGFVNIELPQKQQSIQVKVRNIHGQLVQEKKFVSQGNLQLQLNGKPGIYFIELMNGKGERANVKVVKR